MCFLEVFLSDLRIKLRSIRFQNALLPAHWYLPFYWFSLYNVVDFIDQFQALIDAPDIVRSSMNFKRLSLTDIKIDIPRMPKKKQLADAIEAAG